MLEGKHNLSVGEIDRVHFSGIFWIILHNCLTKYCINWVDSTEMWYMVLIAGIGAEKCLKSHSEGFLDE